MLPWQRASPDLATWPGTARTSCARSHCACGGLSPRHPRAAPQTTGTAEPGLPRSALPARRVSQYLGRLDRCGTAPQRLSDHGPSARAGTRALLRSGTGGRTGCDPQPWGPAGPGTARSAVRPGQYDLATGDSYLALGGYLRRTLE